ncbi:MAG: hypothetical protein ACI8ZB_003509, partial [Desulforhopalus sp.]
TYVLQRQNYFKGREIDMAEKSPISHIVIYQRDSGKTEASSAEG